ncbi:MAG: hypothetical protein WCS82_08165 [Candidatus Riflebacteria bacterium]|jgi:hypothetical protein
MPYCGSERLYELKNSGLCESVFETSHCDRRLSAYMIIVCSAEIRDFANIELLEKTKLNKNLLKTVLDILNKKKVGRQHSNVKLNLKKVGIIKGVIPTFAKE